MADSEYIGTSRRGRPRKPRFRVNPAMTQMPTSRQTLELRVRVAEAFPKLKPEQVNELATRLVPAAGYYALGAELHKGWKPQKFPTNKPKIDLHILLADCARAWGKPLKCWQSSNSKGKRTEPPAFTLARIVHQVVTGKQLPSNLRTQADQAVNIK